ncbi:winged helix-turn-helix transcriptional regulator [Demequina sp. SO4-13]|uniref:winged helix-turn-helix transcriptional regulator n=1 Tax=Demequina sp. SO4-13 TaxID=3401027 RepID=UPI003AF89075
MASDIDKGQMLSICTEDDPAIFRSVLDRLADKWTLIIVGLLEVRALRFTELLDSIPGISRRMLTRTLRSLERDGLVHRKIYAEIPPRVEYRATELGLSLSEPVLALATWVDAHKQVILSNRETYDVALDGPDSSDSP